MTSMMKASPEKKSLEEKVSPEEVESHVKEEEEVWSVLLMALMVKGVRISFNWSHRDELQLIKEVFGTIFSSFGVLLLLPT